MHIFATAILHGSSVSKLNETHQESKPTEEKIPVGRVYILCDRIELKIVLCMLCVIVH